MISDTQLFTDRIVRFVLILTTPLNVQANWEKLFLNCGNVMGKHFEQILKRFYGP